MDELKKIGKILIKDSEIENNDNVLFSLLCLEIFQAGLSWETILNKRDNFNLAFHNFEASEIMKYDSLKIDELLLDKGIIRNKKKIMAVINNARIFLNIEKDYGSFYNYIWHFTNKEIIYHDLNKEEKIAELISNDLKKLGMFFVGKKIIFAYLEAIGVFNNHEKSCFKYHF